MELQKSLLIGMVKPLSVVDKMLQSQGFSRRGRHTITYDIQIEDAASHTIYYLRIPARRTSDNESKDTFIKLDRPYLGKRRGPHRYHSKWDIPDSVVEAAQHKMAEVASYLETTNN